MPKAPTKVQGAATSPAYTAIRITRDGVSDGLVHDGGLGGVHALGKILAVVDKPDDQCAIGSEVPRWIADLFISKDLAVIEDGAGVGSAKKRGKEIAEEAVRATQKAVADSQMRGYDDMPPELRALAQEHGDEIVSLWQSGESADDIIKAFAK